MRRTLVTLASAGAVVALFVTAARPGHRIGYGPCSEYKTSWTRDFKPKTVKVPCSAPTPAPGTYCAEATRGTETLSTPYGVVKIAWLCSTGATVSAPTH